MRTVLSRAILEPCGREAPGRGTSLGALPYAGLSSATRLCYSDRMASIGFDMRRLLPLAALSLACDVSRGIPGPSTEAPAQPIATVEEPIEVNQVEVRIVEVDQVSVRVTGVVGDGCSTLLPEEVTRGEQEVRVDIRRRRRTSGVCSQLAPLYDAVISLGAFAPGLYSLRVNSVASSFRID